MTTNNTTFDFIETTTDTSVTADSRKLVHTDLLITTSKERAAGIMKSLAGVKDADEKKSKIEALTSGKAEELMELIKSFIKEDQIKSDADFLKDCSEEEFSKLLESRRSDRSKKFKAGVTSSASNCQAYIGAMYAEMLIRQAWNKPYNPTQTVTEVDVTDQEAIRKKIKSLQSKKCRLSKTAKFDDADRIELEATEAEIARLSQFRPTVNVKAAVKSADTEVLRQALKAVQSTLSPEQLDSFQKAGLL